LNALQTRLDHAEECPINEFARRWWEENKGRAPQRLRMTFVAQGLRELSSQLAMARAHLQDHPDTPINSGGLKSDLAWKDRVFYAPKPLAESGEIAFIFPGSGNHFPGMGRDLLL